jgi:hypothetical protein
MESRFVPLKGQEISAKSLMSVDGKAHPRGMCRINTQCELRCA